LARSLIAFDGAFGISSQGADEDEQDTQHKGRDHEGGEVRGNNLPEEMEFHIQWVEKGKPAEK
jgi:hypothetical protein